MNPTDDRDWFDEPRNGRKVFWGVAVICGVVVLLDWTYHKHVHYGWEEWIGFHGFYGFVSCVALVLLARVLRVLVKRDEDYYD